MVHEALDAARRVEEEGISTEVIDLRTVQPYDVATVTASVERTGRLLVVHEAVTEFGAGAEIAARVQEEAFGMLDAPVGRLGAPFAPTPFTPTQERRHVPDAEAIRRRLLELARF
jgi:pyruvate dehydrogenase E1 component beta subunit